MAGRRSWGTSMMRARRSLILALFSRRPRSLPPALAPRRRRCRRTSSISATSIRPSSRTCVTPGATISPARPCPATMRRNACWCGRRPKRSLRSKPTFAPRGSRSRFTIAIARRARSRLSSIGRRSRTCPAAKTTYYPNLPKSALFPDYIATRSGHSRGATRRSHGRSDRFRVANAGRDRGRDAAPLHRAATGTRA